MKQIDFSIDIYSKPDGVFPSFFSNEADTELSLLTANCVQRTVFFCMVSMVKSFVIQMHTEWKKNSTLTPPDILIDTMATPAVYLSDAYPYGRCWQSQW